MAEKCRMGVVETVFHQAPGEQPVASEARYSRFLASDEQPYVRRVKVGEAAQSIDGGWLESVGCMVLKNEEGPHSPATVYVYCGDTVLFRVRPGESMRAEPTDVKLLALQSVKGVARLTITLFPG